MDITIYRNQLKLDADIETRKAGMFQIAKDRPEELNEAQMGMEESDLSYFERQCQQGVDDLLTVLHRFVTGCTGETPMGEAGNNKLENTKQWVISLSFDSRRNVIARALAGACHRFVLMTALHAWAVMTMPAMAEQYMARRNDAAAAIREMIYRKEPPTLQE